MTRQVRLDDDVAAFVEARSDGYSLSGSANRLLRELAADPPEAAPVPSPAPDAPTADSAPEDDWPEPVRPPEATQARRARTAHRPLCKHPLQFRVGLRCGACGARFPR